MPETTPASAVPESPVPSFLPALIERAREADGQPPFSDQSLVDARTGERAVVAIGESAVALVSATEAEFVVDPAARGRGTGTALLEQLLARTADPLLIWAHGDHPAARALAASHGLVAVRELLHLRCDFPTPVLSAVRSPKHSAEQPAGVDVSADMAVEPRLSMFRVGTDEDAWVALNARAFVTHPEQGAVTRADLDELINEDWFAAEDFLLLWSGDSLVGYCWLKIERDSGEFYVVGVDPDAQGSGFGRRLTEAGMARLRERGVAYAHLYVEAENTAAVNLYRSLGFRDDSIDIQYSAAAR
ncbi:MAG: mycothiol synthase [Glaciihabitans sp.]|nr:mycothiol synthase [Glaciihabitans sp.]